MKRRTIERLAAALLVSGLGLAGCSQPVKNPPLVSAQEALKKAKEAYQRNEFAQAADWYRKAAEQGEAKAQYNLGMAYDTGKGVEQDYRQAGEWYRKAADKNLAPAQNNLGLLYKQGKGVAQNYVQADFWFRKAALQGYDPAQFNLGLAYRDGQGVQQDLAQAGEWLGKAAALGNEQAKAALKALKDTTKPSSASKKAAKSAGSEP